MNAKSVSRCVARWGAPRWRAILRQRRAPWGLGARVRLRRGQPPMQGGREIRSVAWRWRAVWGVRAPGVAGRASARPWRTALGDAAVPSPGGAGAPGAVRARAGVRADNRPKPVWGSCSRKAFRRPTSPPNCTCRWPPSEATSSRCWPRRARTASPIWCGCSVPSPTSCCRAERVTPRRLTAVVAEASARGYPRSADTIWYRAGVARFRVS